MNPALLVIDMQNDFFQSGPLADRKDQLIQNINELVDKAHQSSIPVIWVRQEYASDLSDAPLHNRKNNKSITIKGTDGAKLLKGLHWSESDVQIIKKRFSAFLNTKLEDTLQEMGVERLIVAGVNTMTCVRVTVIDAYQRDIPVILALDCVDGYDKEQHDNSIKYLQYSVSIGKVNAQILQEDIV